MQAKLLLSLSPLFAGIFLLLAGIGALGSIVPLRLGQSGVDDMVVGLVGGTYFFGLFCGTFYAHRLIGGVGHVRAFAALASTLSAATLGHPFLIAPLPWAALRFIEGLCLAGVFMCVESWLNERADSRQRGQVLSVYMVAVYLGQASGQLLLTLADENGFRVFVLSSLLMSLAIVPVAISRGPVPAPPQPSRIDVRRLLAISPLSITTTTMSGIMIGAFYSLAPLFAQQRGLDFAQTSHFMALAILGGTMLQWPVGRLSDRFDRRSVLLGVTAGAGAAALAIALADGFGYEGLLLAPLLGGLMFTLYPISVAHAMDRTAVADLVPVSGTLVTMYGLGAAIGPLGASLTMTRLGADGLFFFIAAISVVGTVFGLRRVRVSERVPAADQGAFQPLPRTTPIASQLDPRAEPVAAPPPGTMPPGDAAETTDDETTAVGAQP